VRSGGEHTNSTALRILGALDIQEKDIVVAGERSLLIHKAQSKYIGLETIHRRHVVSMRLNMDHVSGDQMARPGWPSGPPLVTATNDESVIWKWVSHEDCNEQILQKLGDPAQIARYCALIPARPKPLTPNGLKKKMKKYGVPPLTDKALGQLHQEEQMGKSMLVEQVGSNDQKTLVRVVKQTTLHVINEAGHVLVEVGSELDDEMEATSALPFIIQEVLENPFSAARRLLTTRFNIEDDEIYFDTHRGTMLTSIEEDRYPGIRSYHDKDFVQVRVSFDKTLSQKQAEQCF
jgi:predicted site-specific integrase-resolvase